MNLQNGYKVIYEKSADGERTFFASKTGLFADAEQIGEKFEIGKYKLIYEKNNKIYGSETGVPAEDDFCFDAFEAVFSVTKTAASNSKRSNRSAAKAETPKVEEPKVEAPEVKTEVIENDNEIGE